jgi:electron transfer flavoprotein beta subunit
MRNKCTYYGLDEFYIYIDPGSDPALSASIASAYEKGEPIVAYYWEPTWLTGKYDLVLLEDPAYVDGDSWSTAYALAMAIKKIGQYDLILCGRQAADWDAGQVGSAIAEILGLPAVTLARKLEIEGDKLRVEKVIPDGYELIESSLPAVVTLSNEHPAPRYPNVKGIMQAKRKEPIVWKPADIGADPATIGSSGRGLKLLKLFQPVREGHCEIVGADTPEEAGAKLAQKLRESKVL